MLNKIRNIVVFIVILVLLLTINSNIYAHGGNITGWKEKDSAKIVEYNGKYYGYHKENGEKHYHQVEWSEESQKWKIINPAVYYDEKFNIIDGDVNEESEKIIVTYYSSVDGDTAKFKLNNEIITVRFLGIDTPETVHTQKEEQPYGKEASNYTKEKLEKAKKIEIEYDIEASKQDKYERELAWVWVDDSLLQKELVMNGLAKTYMLQNNYRYADILQLAETEAKNNKINIWSRETTENQISDDSQTTNQNETETISLIIIIPILIIMLIVPYIKKSKGMGRRKK